MKVYFLIGKYESDSTDPLCSTDYSSLHKSMESEYEETLRALGNYSTAYIGDWEATIETPDVYYGWAIHEFEVGCEADNAQSCKCYDRNCEAAINDGATSPLYMGVLLDMKKLMSREELTAYLRENGMSDRGIAGLREQQYAQFGKELIWRYPLCDGNSLGGYIFPVKEGFLWIPYDEVESDRGELLVMEDAELLDVDGLKSLREDFAAYSADLCAALKEAEVLIASNDVRSNALGKPDGRP